MAINKAERTSLEVSKPVPCPGEPADDKKTFTRKSIDKWTTVGHHTKVIERLVGFWNGQAIFSISLPETLARLQGNVMKT